MESFKISEIFPVKPDKIYTAWLDSKAHSEITGSAVKIDPVVNGKFRAWDGYITGITIELIPDKLIVQKWRTTEFPSQSPDSTLALEFEETGAGTKLTLTHTDIPDGQSENYKQGWLDYYFEPMKKYFTE